MEELLDMVEWSEFKRLTLTFSEYVKESFEGMNESAFEMEHVGFYKVHSGKTVPVRYVASYKLLSDHI